jgi:molybdate transport system substrate-binding protein
MRLRSWLVVVPLLGSLLGAAPVQPLAIAAATDLRGTLEELAGGFQRENPSIQVRINYGASGSLAAQIQQGAPFDVFLSADLAYPEQLIQAGRAAKEGLLCYATGKLVLWVRKEASPAPGNLQSLANPALKRIALANPKVAPYGRAGEEALRRAGLYTIVEARLVFAENVAQAAQYLQTGAADAGLVSISQARQPALLEAGWSWPVPQELYAPLQQGAVLLTGGPNTAEGKRFLDFLAGPTGQGILARHGFGRP